MDNTIKINGKYYLTAILFLTILCSAAAQSSHLSITGLSIPQLQVRPTLFKFQTAPIQIYKAVLPTPATSVLHWTHPKLALPLDYAKQLGFFCKGELKMDQQARIPVRFRLGTIDYVNTLEGK